MTTPEQIGYVCESGHIRYYWNDMRFTPGYCYYCGKPLLQGCPVCGEEILFSRPNRERSDLETPPFYCERCGSPFPWNTSKETADEGENEG